MASHYGVDGIPNIVMIGVPDEAALKEACSLLSSCAIPHWSWHEPDEDMGLGFTAIATAAIEGAQRKALAHYKLWKSERVISSIGGAEDSNSSGFRFESEMTHQSTTM